VDGNDNPDRGNETMNTMKHTPGPWEYSSGQVWADGTAKCVARRGADSGIPPEQRDADMRLCAAAPELLAALKAAVAALRDNDVDEAMAGEFENLTDAIAKAEGRD
jgi:hypothetical protein